MPRFVLSFLHPAGVAFPQTISPGAVKEAAVELNPFVVTAETDDGYVSKETLSGTRLGTDIKNVASAMSVITAEMLRDMGATSFYDVVDFLPSTFSHGSNEGDGNANGLRTGSPFVVRGYRSTPAVSSSCSARPPASASSS
jgi:outer membrane receptor protein involved in Fe transport